MKRLQIYLQSVDVGVVVTVVAFLHYRRCNHKHPLSMRHFSARPKEKATATTTYTQRNYTGKEQFNCYGENEHLVPFYMHKKYFFKLKIKQDFKSLCIQKRTQCCKFLQATACQQE